MKKNNCKKTMDTPYFIAKMILMAIPLVRCDALVGWQLMMKTRDATEKGIRKPKRHVNV
jgi:hypothetical protein